MKQAVKKSMPRAMKAAPVTATETAPETAARVKPKAKAKAAVMPGKATREPKPKKELDQVVFAIRIDREDRDAIHEAAGPARATKFIRAVAIAAAHGDVEAFRAALKEAEAARAKAASKK